MPLRYSKSLVNKHLNCYCLTSPQSFNHIWSYRTPIQEKLVSLEKLRHEATRSMFKENPVMPLR